MQSMKEVVTYLAVHFQDNNNTTNNDNTSSNNSISNDNTNASDSSDGDNASNNSNNVVLLIGTEVNYKLKDSMMQTIRV